MEKIVISDISVEKAIQKGLIKLNEERDNVTIRIIEEGKKGLFGFGQKNAIVELQVKEVTKFEKELVFEEAVQADIEQSFNTKNSVVEEVIEKEKMPLSSEEKNEYDYVCVYLESIAKEYGTPVKINVKVTSKKVYFNIDTEKVGLLIGKHGKIINSLQVLAQNLVYKQNEKSPMIVVNIGDYRQKREVKLKEVAKKTAHKVLKTKQAVFLEPLPAYERKIIHAELSHFEGITTHSEGKEPYRYLVVEYEG